MKRIFVFLLCACLLLTTFASVSCKGKEKGQQQAATSKQDEHEPSGEFSEGAVEFTDELIASKTTHDIRYTETSATMVADGESEYVIVIPADAPTMVYTAQGELVAFFREATGCTLSVTTDADLTYSADKKYISLGFTTLAQQAGVSADGLSLKTQGYIVRTVGQSVFVLGQERGVLMGVYKLLNIWFEFDQMNDDYYHLLRDVRTVPLYAFEITDVPDIDYRISPYGGAFNNRVACRRMGMMHDQDVVISRANSHDMLRTIIPYEEYRETHPKWYASTTAPGEQNQACYTAHGDAAEYELMVECAFEHLKAIIIDDPNHNVATMTQMDWNTWCTCESCNAIRQRYGTEAATQILFANDVAAKLKPWLRDEMNGREVELVIFAYHKTVKAPAVKNEENKWVPIDDEIVMKDVSVWLAPIGGNFIDSVFSPANFDMYDLCESWQAIAPKFLFWGYDCHFGEYLVPMDTYKSMQDMIKELVRCDTSMFWAQGSYNLRNSTGFDNVKAYLYSKLMWDCSLNINDLIHDYFTKTYRAAAPTMEEAFWSMRTLFAEQQRLDGDGSVWNNSTTAESWPSRYLFGQLELFDRALTELEVYRDSDPDFYALATIQVRLESVSPRYLIIRLFPSSFSDRDFDAFLDAFAADVRELDVNRISEGGSMESFLERYDK